MLILHIIDNFFKKARSMINSKNIKECHVLSQMIFIAGIHKVISFFLIEPQFMKSLNLYFSFECLETAK